MVSNSSEGFLIAKFLGPFLLGIWGFIMLMRQYLTYSSLGLQYAVTLELSTQEKQDSTKQEQILTSALTPTLVIAFFLVVTSLSFQLLDLPIFEKYDFSRYTFLLGCIVGLSHLVQIFTNYYRVQGSFGRIAVVQIIEAALPLISVFFFRGEVLVFALLYAMILANILGLTIFLVKAPFKIHTKFDRRSFTHIARLGIPLLIYNLSYQLIMVSARTILSISYPVEVMGLYSLASSITTATLLGLRSLAWVAIPDIYSRTHKKVNDEIVLKTVNTVNDIYGTSVFLIVLLIVVALPALFYFLPGYQPAEMATIILLLAQAVLAASFGYNSLAIARGDQNKVAQISMFAVVIVSISSLSAAYLEMDFVWIAVSVLIGAFTFTLLQARLGYRLLHAGMTKSGYFSTVLPLGSILAIVAVLAGIIFKVPFLGGLSGLIVFLLTNRRKLNNIREFVWHRIG